MANRGNPGPIFGTVADRFYSEVHRSSNLLVKYNNGRYIDRDRKESLVDPNPVDNDIYARVRVIPATPSRPELGPDAQTRYTGSLMVMIFQRMGSGESLTDDIVSRVLAFQQTIESGINYRTADMQEIGRSSDGSWWQTNVTIPFWFSL